MARSSRRETTIGVTQSNTGSITTDGSEADGIVTTGTGTSSESHNADVTINGSVTANGINSAGVSITGTYGQVSVDIGGSIMGGSGNGAGVNLDNPHAAPTKVTLLR